MSPEQARGQRVDHRSDIFSFGLLLHEMLTAHPAFQGQSSLDTLQAILSQPMPPLPSSAALPAEIAHEVQRVIAKCAAKDAEDRYQGMRDVAVDLRAARRSLESASMATSVSVPAAAPIARPAGGVRRPVVLGVAAVIIASVLAIWRPWQSAAPARGPGKPSVAVLYFDNNTGDSSLDWMRTGLADMMVTDLSQSADIEVLGTDHVYQILQELNRADDRVISAEVVQEIARRAKVDRVVLGSYVKAGDTIRISARLQEAHTGRVVTAERVEGPGAASLFSLVDELTRRIKAQMAELSRVATGNSLLSKPGAEREEGLDRGVREITTSSIEAFRYYAEGVHLHERFLEAEALPLLEKAIAIDPKFAMAYAKLAVISGNIGHGDKRAEYGRLAVENSDRLTARERYYIEGLYKSMRPDTFMSAIEAYEQGLALHPEHQASRHNLALLYMQLERFDKAIEHNEELRRRGVSNPTTYGNLADCYAALGDIPRARVVVEEFVQQHPENAAGYSNLAEILIAEGRFPDAQAALDRAESLGLVNNQVRWGRWVIAAMQERWPDAVAASAQLLASADPFQQFVGHMTAGTTHLAQGRLTEALAEFDMANRVGAMANRVYSRATVATLLMAVNRPDAALALAEAAHETVRGRAGEFDILVVLATAQAAAGRRADAEKSVAALAERASKMPGVTQQRLVRWARGNVARLTGDLGTATTELSAAVDRLPRGPVLLPDNQLQIWFAMASTHLAAGRDAEAAAWLERIVTAGHERVYAFLPYVRSHFLLAQILEKRGDARAKQLYARFVDFWRNGEIDRAQVAEALKKIK
jgi:tetratricopeptide (TPR) repeat protein